MKKIVVSQLKGGLGNQMFQYAIAKSIAIQQGAILKLDVDFFEYYDLHKLGLHIFDLEKHYLSKKHKEKMLKTTSVIEKALQYFKIKKPIIHFEEKDFSFSKEVFLITSSIYLQGYWQSEKYFNNIEDIIRDDFEVKIKPTIENQKLLEKIKIENSISIHVRRGNYVTNKETLIFHGTCSLEYYKLAIDFFEQNTKNPIFYIFSNDIMWCKDEFSFMNNVVYVDINNDDTNYEDLRLMSFCKHNIIANSSFSWWGAWLNKNPNKIVIAPKQWFANKEMQAQTQDLIPETWIQM